MIARKHEALGWASVYYAGERTCEEIAMRTSSKCPKCRSTEIVHIPGTVSAYGAGNNIAVGTFAWSSIKVSRYLCGSCGFSEDWIDETADIKKLRETFGSVS